MTFDHERVDPDLVAELEAAGRIVRPSSTVMRMADKGHQRRFLAGAGFPVPEFVVVSTSAGIDGFAARHGWPVVAKTTSGGYDGRGVFVLDHSAMAAELVDRLDGAALVVEPRLDIECELAVVIARRPGGDAVAYPVVETVQVDGICVETVAPARVEPAVAAAAAALALRIADTIGAVGILAVELFLTPDGLVVNELAPRPHNSGHWTIEGAVTSQFENHLRGILDCPWVPPTCGSSGCHGERTGRSRSRRPHRPSSRCARGQRGQCPPLRQGRCVPAASSDT